MVKAGVAQRGGRCWENLGRGLGVQTAGLAAACGQSRVGPASSSQVGTFCVVSVS